MILMMVIMMMMMMMMMMVMINVSSTVMLQGALDLIVEWTSTWQLQLYVSKCNVNYNVLVMFPLMLNTLCMIQCYHMSLPVGTWELSLHKISLRQSTLAKLPLKHISVLTVQRHKPANESIYCLHTSNC